VYLRTLLLRACVESEVRASLQLSPVDWNKKFPSVQMPKQDDLLVFISTRGKRAGRAAAIASNLGYSGYATFSVDVSGASATLWYCLLFYPCSQLLSSEPM